jgi:outer membrane receptor protein involved in Fe transport
VVPGLLAVQHQGGGKADQLFLRGFDADHGTDVAVFVDDVPINLPSHAHGQGYTDLHWLIPEAIERIDVQKGPYDVRYGDFATAGVLHLRTRAAFDRSSVTLTLGGYPTLGCADFPARCKAVAQQRLVGIVAPQLGGWAQKLKPWIAFEAARDDGPIAAGQELLRWNLFAKLTYDPTPSTTVGLFFTGYGGGWRSSGQIPSREVDAGALDRFGAIDPTEGGDTQRYSINAFFRYHEGRHELSVNAYYTRYRMALWNNFTFFLRDPERGDQNEQDDDRHVAGLRLSYHAHARWRSIALRTTVGAQLRWDTTQLDLWDAARRVRTGRHVEATEFPFGNASGVSVLSLAAFVEEDVVFNRHLRAVVGLRGDLFNFAVDDRATPTASGTALRALASPKATLVVTPARPLDLFINFGMGFHSNDARIAAQEGRETPRGSVVNTVPRFYGGELGARVTLWRRLSIAAALWASYLENESVFVGDAGAFAPSDPTRRFGVDGELRLEALPWLFFDLDVACANATSVPNRGNGGAVALAPRLYMTGGATVRHPVGVRAGLRFRYLGPRPAFETSSEEYQTLAATDPRRVTAEGWFVVDLYAAYRYRWLEVAVAIQNLFNAEWREAQFGNRSCTRAELAGAPLCAAALPSVARVGVADVHFTPGVPFNLQLTLKASF